MLSIWRWVGNYGSTSGKKFRKGRDVRAGIVARPHCVQTEQLLEKALLVGSGNLDHPLRRSWNAFRELIAPFVSSPYLAIGLPVIRACLGG